ncbi:MAG: bifunctional [glutamine synthetase] adenylyltransferase/[glutamine synthetase]-adenylyl-L-tyrosine phosphorylase [Actinobacteria bacterium]|nr:bifunctional [glutamine synthetase] adenylyltransferase/[glutamine synthetase]-adenylyl-L-tyrosine phosphorylase [Actinomycetota bacterium]
MAPPPEAIPRAADPQAVEVALERLVAAMPALAARLQEDPGLRTAVVAVVGASQSMARLLRNDPAAVDVLATLDRRPGLTGDAGVEEVVRWKRRELLRIAARDLLGLDRLEQVGEALARLADEVLQAALRLARPAGAGMAVVAMGKLGARELNYASDIDLVFVGQGDPRPVLDVARRCYRVDVNLRPEGRSGSLVRTLASYEAYWDRWAQPWEFQALLKARPAAGDEAIGTAFAAAAAERVWGRPFGAEQLHAVRSMKARLESQVSRRGLADRELKIGRGGIRDIEFAVQLLQLVHGGQDPALRISATLPTLAELSSAGYIDPADGATLDAGYRFLRAAEHRLQLVEEQPVRAVPADAAARAALAGTLGYRDAQATGPSALQQFDDDLRSHQANVRAVHDRLYFRPLLEVFAGLSTGAAEADGGAGPRLPERAVEERLAAFGFADVERTRVALRELTGGLTRSSRLMAQLLPLLLQWLSESPDPEAGLLGLRALATGTHRRSRLIEAFRESPEVARRLCLLLGTGRLLQRRLEQHPETVKELGAQEGPTPRARRELAAHLRRATTRPDPQKSLRKAKEGEELRIAACDVLGLADARRTAGALTALAEAVLDTTVALTEPKVPLAVVALGRFGGAELSYASDLDVLFVHDGQTSREAASAETTAESVLRLMHGTSPATRIATLDPGLRPEGRHGSLSRSLESYAAYYGRWAHTWERQALVRARIVAGNASVGQRFLDMIEPFVWGPLSDDEQREIRRMKARIERERIPPGEDAQFHLKLGRGSLADVEWTVQLLQLRHHVVEPSTLSAIAELEARRVLLPADARVLEESYRFCDQTRNRWYLISGGSWAGSVGHSGHGDSLPRDPEQLTRLGRSLGLAAGELREEYRRVTRRARAVCERLFYGAAG